MREWREGREGGKKREREGIEDMRGRNGKE